MTDYSDLINKTIYDFCDDEKIISKINDFLPKEVYIERINNLRPYGRAFDFYELARLTKDKKLKKAVDEQLGKFVDEFYDE